MEKMCFESGVSEKKGIFGESGDDNENDDIVRGR